MKITGARTYGIVALFLAVATIALAPGRPIAVQDDAAYVRFALALAKGDYAPTPLLLAAAWPQALLGAGLIRLLPQVSALSLMGWLTWILFCALVVATVSRARGSLAVTLGFFAFPLFFQYGSAYLSEIFACALLLAAAWPALRAPGPSPAPGWKSLAAAGLATAVLVLQRQTLVALPVAWALAALWPRRSNDGRESVGPGRSAAAPWLIGSAAGLVVYAALPRSLAQRQFFGFWLHFWASQGLVAWLACLVQWIGLVCAAGLFFLPLLFEAGLTGRRAWQLGALQCLLFAGWMAAHAHLTFGVLFTQYLSPGFSPALASCGVWGWFAVFRLWTRAGGAVARLGLATVFALMAILAFAVFLGADDLKYALPGVFAIFFAVSSLAPGPSENALRERRTPFGRRWSARAALLYTLILFAVSALVNRYNLDTNEWRWKLARELEARGVPRSEISAGYGRDFFELGDDCARRALAKLKIGAGFPDANPPSDDFNQHLLLASPRVYQDGWVPRFLIRPSRVAGHEIRLRQNIQPGVGDVPVREERYRVFGFGRFAGLDCAVAVFRNPVPVPAWCDRP